MVHAAEYDGLGRRIQKTVTHSGDLDGAFTYLYNGNQIIEVRNGSDDVELLVVHAEADWSGRVKGYIDEIVCQRVKDRGWAYVHQAEGAQGGSVKDWNVTALTAMNGAVIERYWYKPYGEFVAAAEYGWFDYDQDGDVDSADAAVVGLGGACLGSSDQACQCMDANGDRDLDSADYAIINAYVSTLTADTQLQRVPAAPSSRRGNPFAHQGLLYDAEIASFQNRARQYAPKARRFMQRDPLVFPNPFRLFPLKFLVCNTYESLYSDPLHNVDPLGLIPDSNFWYCRPRPFDCATHCPTQCESDRVQNAMTDAGHVLCSGNCMCACVNNEHYPPSADPTDTKIRDCVFEHEEYHVDTGVCLCLKPKEVCFASVGHGTECDAYRVQRNCLESKKSDTDCDADCQGAIDAEIRIIERAANVYEPGCFPVGP